MKNLLTFGLALLFALGGLDFYLQLAEIQTPIETRIDPQMGPTYIPLKRISRFNEGFFIGSANAYGYMGPAVPRQRQKAERRILLLGDSFVLGHTVLPRLYFGRFLESRLKEMTGMDVRALNFGRADFNFWNMYQYYRDFASTFDHDLALFFVEERDLCPTPQTNSSLYPAVQLQGNLLVCDRSFNKSQTFRFYKAVEPLITNSAILRLVFNAYKIYGGAALTDIAQDLLAPRRSHPKKAEWASLSESTKELPAISRAILADLSRDKRNILVIRRDFSPALLNEVHISGIPIIDLASYLDSLQAIGMDPYYWEATGVYGHWNPDAHRLIGSFLAGALLSQGLF